MGQNKHDAFFKRAFADVRVAASAISAALPLEVSEMLDWSTLALAPTESVDAAHNAFRTDLVYSVKVHGRDARVVVLVEHKSAPAPLLAFQILQYLVQLWDAELRRVPAPTKLPPIVPIVLSHAHRRQPRDLIESVDLLPDERGVLGRYVPRVFFEVDELASATDRTLLGRAMLPEATLVLLALRDVGRAKDVPQMMDAGATWCARQRRTQRASRCCARSRATRSTFTRSSMSRRWRAGSRPFTLRQERRS